jgi:hypothetical protein
MMSFLRFRAGSSNDGAGQRLALFGQGGSAGTDTGSQLASPFDVVIQEGSLSAPSAPGVGKSWKRQLKVAGNPAGPLLTLSDANLSARLALNVTIAQLVLHLLTPSTAGAPSVVVLNDVYRYLCSFPNEDTSLYGAGDESSNITLAATNRFFGFNGAGVGEGTATESAVQIPWPCAGSFIFMGGRVGVGNVTTADIVLRKGGVDTALKISPTGAVITTYSDLSDIVSVAAGDLVSFRYVRTGGAGVSISAGLILGFHGSY